MANRRKKRRQHSHHQCRQRRLLKTELDQSSFRSVMLNKIYDQLEVTLERLQSESSSLTSSLAGTDGSTSSTSATSSGL